MYTISTSSPSNVVSLAPTAPAEVVIGTHVVITGRNQAGEAGLMEKLREKGYPGTIAYISPDRKVVNVQFGASDINNSNIGYTYSWSAITVISKETFDKVRKVIMEKTLAKYYEASKKIRELPSSKRVAIDERNDFDINTREYLDTNINFVRLADQIASDNTLAGKPTNYPGAICCALTKTSHNIGVYIPKDWLVYFGYSIIDLKMWLKFLEELGTGYKGVYVREVVLHDVYGNASVNMSTPVGTVNNILTSPYMEAYEVVIPSLGPVNSGNAILNMRNYMHFLLTRYLYNKAYWNIPLIAMQIKRAMGSNITNWEALLVAHMNYGYNGYYALVANTNSAFAAPTRNNTYEEVCKKIGSGMNGAFIYTSDPMALGRVRAAIRGKNYGVIQEFLNEWRNVK